MYEGQIYKTLNQEDYTITPFFAYKGWNFTADDIYINSITTGSGIQFLEGQYSSSQFTSTATEVTNSDGTLKRSVYDLINKIYYANSSNQHETFGEWNLGLTNYDLKNSFIYIGIPNIKFGDGIRSGSFSIVSGTHTITDDGYGNLISGSNSDHIGNIFYKTGDIVLTNTGSDAYADISSSYFETLSYRGKVKIYEHEISCVISKGELTMTLNNTAYSGSDVYGTLVGGNGLPLNSILSSGEWNPYITTVGLYDDDHNLLITGKLAKPVMNDRSIDMSFVLKFDT